MILRVVARVVVFDSTVRVNVGRRLLHMWEFDEGGRQSAHGEPSVEAIRDLIQESRHNLQLRWRGILERCRHIGAEQVKEGPNFCTASRRKRHHDTASVVRVRLAASVSGPFEAIEERRHGCRCQTKGLTQRPRGERSFVPQIAKSEQIRHTHRSLPRSHDGEAVVREGQLMKKHGDALLRRS